MAKQRQVRMEPALSPQLLEEMEDWSDEQLENDSKHRSIALAMLGDRAAKRYDADAARTYFRRAIAAARPQERMQIRRMAEASMALAERRPDDLKRAAEKLGQAPPSNRALFALRLMGLIVPPARSSPLLRARGIGIVLLIVLALLGAGLAVVEVIAVPFGGIGVAPGLLLGLIVVGIALAVLVQVGRRRQKAARPGGRSGPPAKGPPAKGSPAKGSPAKGSAASAKGSGGAPSRGKSAPSAPRPARRGPGTPEKSGASAAVQPPAKGRRQPSAVKPSRPKRPAR